MLESFKESIKSDNYFAWMQCCLLLISVQECHCKKDVINPLRVKFFRGNKNIYLHFMSFLHIDMTQVVEILS